MSDYNMLDYNNPCKYKNAKDLSNKEGIREYFRHARHALSEADYHTLSQKICEQILAILTTPTNIHLFLPIERLREVNLMPLLPKLWERGDKLYVPRVTADNTLEHIRLLPDTDIALNKRGIPEPPPQYPAILESEINNIDIVLTPLLACDKRGYRVGYGGGFYDAFFHDYPHLRKIGVGFFKPLDTIQDIYKKDIALDSYISPSNFIRFDAKTVLK